MQLTGQITNIQPTQRGGYQSQHGYVYTFDMTVNGPQGPITGEVGSKSQQYPKSVGETVTINVQNGQYGNKFKVINPQQQGGHQQQSSNKPDWDKIAEGKVLCNVVCAAIQAGMMPVNTFEEAQKVTDFIMGKPTQSYQPPSQQEPPYGGPQDGSDIPF